MSKICLSKLKLYYLTILKRGCMNSELVKQELRKMAKAERAVFMLRFFKTGKGEYGEGDKFLGLTVPETRKVAKKFQALAIDEVGKLLASKIHDDRACGLFILTYRFPKLGKNEQEEV